MSNTANLGLNFTTSGAEAAEKHLDAIATKSAGAERAADGMAASNKRAGGAIAQMVASIEKAVAEMAAIQRAQMGVVGSSDQVAKATNRVAAEQEALIRTTQRLNAAHGSAVGSSKALTQAGLNMSRQFADIGVTAAMGMNPLMILIQQGPQIADVFAQAKTQGLGFSDIVKGLAIQLGLLRVTSVAATTGVVGVTAANTAAAASSLASATAAGTAATANVVMAETAVAAATAQRVALAPLAIVLAGIAAAAAAIGGVFALSARQINEENKGLINSMGLTKDQLEDVKNKTVTMGDVAVGTFNGVKAAMLETFGPQLKSAGKALDDFFDGMASNTVKVVKTIVGGFMGAYGAIVATWKMLPAAFGDATISAANLALGGLQKLINGAIGLINPLIEGMNARFKLSIPTLPQVEIAKLSNQYAGAMNAVGKAATAAMAKGLADGSGIVDRTIGAVGAETLKAARARIKKEAGDGPKAAQAAKDQSDALMKLDDSLVGVIEKEIRMSDAVKVANDNIRTMNDTLGNFRVPYDLENLITALERSREAAYNVARSIDDILYSIKGNDWAGAFSGLLRTIDQVKKAFSAAGTAQDKMSAIAGVAQGVGSAIGGKTGSAISGAASGAMTGFQLGGPWGAAIGGALGGITSLLGSSSAKKKQKADEAAAKAAAEAARQQEILNQKRALEIDAMEAQGWSFVALTMRRADELAKMNEANRASAVALHALQDAAVYRELELKLIEATSGAEATLDARRHTQLAGMNPLHHAIQQQIWAEEDLTKAREAAAELAEKVASRQTDIQSQIDGMTLSSGELLAKTRAAEMAEAVKLDDKLGPLLTTLYGLQDAATLAAAATEEANKALAATQEARPYLIRLMEMDDAVLGTTAALTAKREDELAGLSPLAQGLAKIVFAREDEATAIAKETAEIEARTAASVAATNQARPYMLRLLEMDDAVLGTTTALIAKRADELAGLGPMAQELAKIVWAREDEGAIIAKNAADLEAANEKAKALAEEHATLEERLASARGQTEIVKAIQRAKELASATDELSRSYLLQIHAAEDAAITVTKAEENLTTARNALAESADRERSRLGGLIDKFKAMGDSFRSFASSLNTGPLAMNDPMQQYARTKADFERVAGLASQGNETALGQLQGVQEAFLEASKTAQTTNLGYFKDLSAVKKATQDAAKYADAQVDVSTQELNALNSLVSAFMPVNDNLISVYTAVMGVQGAINALANVTATQAAAKTAAAAAASQAAAVQTMGLNDNSSNPKSSDGVFKQNDILDFDFHQNLRAILDAQAAGDQAALARAFAAQSAGVTKFAAGGVFTNGIVSQPTAFDMGMMGEAGAEAIVPLVRGPEGLGVRMSGGGGNSEVVAMLGEVVRRLDRHDAALVAIATTNSSMDRREKRAEIDGVYVRGQQPGDPVETEVAA